MTPSEKELTNWLLQEIEAIKHRMSKVKTRVELNYLEGRLYSLLDCKQQILFLTTKALINKLLKE